MRRLVFIACMSFLAIKGIAQEKQAVLKVLDAQGLAWNKGDLETFMQTYWKSDSLLFVGQNGAKYGWKTTLDNYRKSYPDKAAMGTLSFDIKDVRFITSTDAFVLGAWHLQRQKDQPHGFFTLLLRKIKGEWLIVTDHSS